MPEQLRLLAPEDASEFLEMDPKAIFPMRNYLHSLVLPRSMRLMTEPYISTLAESNDWRDRDTNNSGAISFARTPEARAIMQTTEEQFDTVVSTTYAAIGRSALLAAEAASILQVTPQTVRSWQRTGELPRVRQDRQPTIDEPSLRMLYSWHHPELPYLTEPKPELETVQFLRRRELAKKFDMSLPMTSLAIPHLHRFVPLDSISAVDPTYADAVKANLSGLSWFRLNSIVEFTASEEAQAVAEQTEANYQRIVDDAFNHHSSYGIITNAVAAKLLGVTPGLISNRRSSGYIPQNQLITREYFETLYEWDYPGRPKHHQDVLDLRDD
jgi:hypothetical protein